AIELEQVLDNVLPLLTAVKPEKLSATLGAVSQALEGRGEKLGETLTTLDAHLKKVNPQLPTLNEDIKQLVKVSTLYAEAAPDVLDALTDATTTSGTIAEQEARLATLYDTTTASARDVTSFLRENKDNLIRLSSSGRPTLELLAKYADSFPCTLRTVAGFVPAMDKALGKGT
nr:MCE family protein [Streptomyces sp. DSM 41633]